MKKNNCKKRKRNLNQVTRQNIISAPLIAEIHKQLIKTNNNGN